MSSILGPLRLSPDSPGKLESVRFRGIESCVILNSDLVGRALDSYPLESRKIRYIDGGPRAPEKWYLISSSGAFDRGSSWRPFWVAGILFSSSVAIRDCVLCPSYLYPLSVPSRFREKSKSVLVFVPLLNMMSRGSPVFEFSRISK